MTFEPYEVVRLLSALLVAVPIGIYYRRIGSHPGRGAVMVALIALLASYIFNVIEVFFAPELMNAAQHLACAVAGIAAAVAAVRLRRFVAEGAGAS